MPDFSKFNNLTRIYIFGEKIARDCSTISKVESLVELHLIGVNLTGNVPDFSNLKKLETLGLQSNYLNTEDVKKIVVLKDNTNLTINLSDNSIIDATALLELYSNTKINLTKNANLLATSKQLLTEHFGSNVTYD